MSPEADSDRPAGENPLRVLCFALLRSWQWIVLGTIVGVSAGLMAGLIKPNTYSSYGKLLLRLGVREQVSEEAVLAGPAAGGRMMLGAREAVSNQAHILASRAVFEKAVQQLGTDAVLAPYDPTQWAGEGTPFYKRWMFSFQKWWFARESAAASGSSGTTEEAVRQVATEVLMRSIAVESAPGSTVFLVGYSSQTPYGAKTVLEGYMRAAEEYHREVYSADDVIKLAQNQIESAERDLSKWTDLMSSFKLERGIFDLDAERSYLQAQLNETDETVKNKVIQQKGIEALLKLRDEELQKTPAEIEQITMSAPQQNPEKTRLSDRIDNLNEQMRELGNLGQAQRDRREKEIKDIIAGYEERKNALKDLVPGQPVKQLVPNPRYITIQSDHDALNGQLVQLEAQIDEEKKLIDVIKSRLTELEKAEPQYRRLDTHLQIAQREINRLGNELEGLNNMRTLDQLKMGNLRILEPASMPLSKSGPSRGKYLIFGLFLGGMFSVALAILRHFIDGRVRRPADLEHGLQIPVLAVVKDTPGARKIGAARSGAGTS